MVYYFFYLYRPIEGIGSYVKVVTDGCSGTSNHVKYVEHVQAKVTLSVARRGDLQIHLTSPNGTRSTLLPQRKHDYSAFGFEEWPFMSVFYWGENPTGTWKLELENLGGAANVGEYKQQAYRWRIMSRFRLHHLSSRL